MPRDLPPGPPASATCPACRRVFEYNPVFYESKGLRPPSRCRPCREERNSRLVERKGQVQRVGPDFVVIETMTAKYIGFNCPPLEPGDRVVFGVDERAPRQPGALPVAKLVRKVA